MERKVKYDLAFKLNCVESVLKDHKSINSISSREGFNKSLLRKWISDYQSKGINGLVPKHKNNKYSQNFKHKVLLAISRENLSLPAARLKFNICSGSTILKWQKDFATFGIDGLHPKPKGRPKTMSTSKSKPTKSKQPLTREEELLLEIERLRCENALLKKFNALIQAQEEKQKKLGRKP